MRYPAIKKDELRTFFTNDFSGGISENAFNGNCIKSCENLIINGTALKTRPALKVCGSFSQVDNAGGNLKLKITNVTKFTDGKKYNLAYHSGDVGGDTNRIRTYLVADGGNISDFGYLSRSRQSRDPANIEFYPSSAVFYSGTRTYGCGIYALVGYKSNNNNELYYSVFEALSENQSSPWYEISEIERYAPTVYANGHGSSYETAKEAFSLSFSEPYSPEKRNLITPYVKGYFSADGMSTYFELPNEDYDLKPVKVRIYLNTDVVEIDFENIGSGSATYGGDLYTANFNYMTGGLSIKKNNELYALPINHFHLENNIMIIASRSNGLDPSAVLSCNDAVSFNSRVYLFKSDVAPNGVYSCKITSPLYFPTNMQTLVGADIDRITGGGYQNDKLIIFKEGETYKVNTSSYETAFSFDSPYLSESNMADSLSNETISTKVGCLNGDTISSCAGQLIWLGNDKKVYTLEATTYGSEKNIFGISEPVDDRILKAFENGCRPFATVKDGYYYLFCGDIVFVCDCHITNMGYATRYSARNLSGVSWYVWKLPHGDYLTAKNCNEIVIGAQKEGKSEIFFLHFEEKGKDETVEYTSGSPDIVERPVSVKLTTADYDFGTPAGKRIDEIRLLLNAGPCEITIITDNRKATRHIHSIKGEVRLNDPAVNGSGTSKIALSFASSGGFLLREIKAFYKAVR